MPDLPFESSSSRQIQEAPYPVILYGHRLDTLGDSVLRGFTFDSALVEVHGEKISLQPLHLAVVTLSCAGLTDSAIADATDRELAVVKNDLGLARKEIDKDARFERGSSRVALYLFATGAFAVAQARMSAGLGPKHQAVLQKCAEGKSNYEIGYELHIAEDTVKSRFKRIYDNLGMRTREAAVMAALTSQEISIPLLKDPSIKTSETSKETSNPRRQRPEAIYTPRPSPPSTPTTPNPTGPFRYLAGNRYLK